MSSETISFDDSYWMSQAIEESRKGVFLAPPNPAVGCVIVLNGRELSRGYTQRPGGNHAEIEAIEHAHAKGLSVKGATVYVTLEPCSHTGRTPPCALRLIQEKVACVVVATTDPNPLVSGRGVRMLREAGIEVREGICEASAVEANIGFITRMRRGTPFVRLKIASSLDGRTSLVNGQSQWITCEAARADGRKLRAYAQGVLTGVGTVLTDDPQMNVRGDVCYPSPAKFVMDSYARTPVTAKILQGKPCTIFVGPHADSSALDALRQAGAHIECLSMDKSGRLDLHEALIRIAQSGVNTLHVEAGARLNGALIQAGLVDEMVMYMAPCLMGDGAAVAGLPKYTKMAQVQRWELVEMSRIGDDIRLRLRKKLS